jgi:Zn-dependent M28 family amino/carboxypeptidase
MGMRIADAKPDLAGGYFRSDHFNFAKNGVPAFSISSGRDYVKDPEGAKAKQQAYGKRYHQADDEYDPAGTCRAWCRRRNTRSTWAA